MARNFEYQICTVQEARVTWVNGVWIGTQPIVADHRQVLDSCPHTWDYLNMVGQDGWELVSSTSTVWQEAVRYETLYLKRGR